MAVEVTLVGKADPVGHLCGGMTDLEQPLCPLKAQVPLIDMRG